MTTKDEQIEEFIEEKMEEISDFADDTARWSQEESMTIYETLAADLKRRADLIRQEMS